MIDLSGVPHYSKDPDDPLLFYGGKLSSFAPIPVIMPAHDSFVPPMIYYTREHWFQACKAQNWHDHASVMRAGGPRRAKDLGRNIPLRAGWDDGLAYDVMVEGIRNQGPLLSYLRTTGRRFIAEDSETDSTWGIRSKPDLRTTDRAKGYGGMNLLGIAHMQARAEFTHVGYGNLMELCQPTEEALRVLQGSLSAGWWSSQ